MIGASSTSATSSQPKIHPNTTFKFKPAPSLVFYHNSSANSTKPNSQIRRNGAIRSFMEKPNSIGSFASKVVGSLPVVGLFARIFSDEGGVGDDIIDFAEFRRRVGKKCSPDDSKAFFDFEERRGKPGDPVCVLLCCWLAAVGAGLMKSEDILEGVARMRISYDIEFEEENFLAIMNDAKERRAKSKATNPEIPMAVRAEKAMEAIYVCCFGKDPIEEEEERLLQIILNAVFPSVGKPEIERIVSDKAKQVAESEGDESPETPLSKEAAQLQLKDLQFLQQNRLSSE